MVNEQVLKYKIFRKIGRGNMVTLYTAYEIENPEHKVVVKIYDKHLAENKEIAQQFEKCAKKIIALEHQNISNELEYEIRNDALILVTELLTGQNLKFATLIKGLSYDENLRILNQTIEAISFLHSKGIIHRDIKPENIFLTENYKKVKILDAGVAGVFGFDKRENISKRIDAPMYFSPEQAEGNKPIDERSDIYSLGVVMYFMFRHKPPFETTTSYDEIINQIIDNPIPDIPGNAELNNIIQKATQKNPADRFQTCGELLNELKLIK
jgi:serine/threonine-protein kinase